MRLSEAMMLGAATCKMEPCDINSCALGAALNAMGVPHTAGILGNLARYMVAREIWPWLNDGTNQIKITSKFDFAVCGGKMTYEQLVDYVRSIEPAEKENDPEGADVKELVATLKGKSNG